MTSSPSAGHLVQLDLVAALDVEVGDVAGEVPAAVARAVAADDAGERSVDRGEQFRGFAGPVTRPARTNGNSPSSVGSAASSSAWSSVARPLARCSDVVLGDGGPDEVAVLADGGQGRPVVAVGELLGTAGGDGDRRLDVGRHLRSGVRRAAVEQRVAVELPVDVGVEQVDDRRQHVEVLGAVVADLAREPVRAP